MNQKKFDKLYKHYVKYFNATEEPRIFHPHTKPGELHVDIVLIKPSEAFPFQVLATIGASDIRLKKDPRTISDRNEYVAFVPADWDMTAPENVWVLNLLGATAQYPKETGELITYSHTIDCSAILEDLQSDDFNMTAVGLLFPEVTASGVLRCKTGLFENVTILQMMPLTRAEMDEIIARREKGTPDWADMFYPEDDTAYNQMPFLCARKR